MQASKYDLCRRTPRSDQNRTAPSTTHPFGTHLVRITSSLEHILIRSDFDDRSELETRVIVGFDTFLNPTSQSHGFALQVIGLPDIPRSARRW
jgi:hypothetical protein